MGAAGVTLRETLQQSLRSRTDVVAAYLFGSHAKGRAGPASDVDVGVLLGRVPDEPYARLGLGLAAELEDALGHPVDVVVLNDAPSDVVHEVLAGELIHEGNRSARVAFEVRARNQYLDLQPFLRLYRRIGANGA